MLACHELYAVLCLVAGALPWVIPALDPKTPIYAGGFVMQLVCRRLQEYNLYNPDRYAVLTHQQFITGCIMRHQHPAALYMWCSAHVGSDSANGQRAVFCLHMHTVLYVLHVPIKQVKQVPQCNC